MMNLVIIVDDNHDLISSLTPIPQCGYESARVDAYLDIPLVIRAFGSTEAYGSVVRLALFDLCVHVYLFECVCVSMFVYICI